MSNSSLSLVRLGVDFVLPLSKQQQQQQLQQEPPPKISAVNDRILDETLKVASWEHLEQILTVTVIFVQATFVQVTFVHIRNISAVTDPILMNL